MMPGMVDPQKMAAMQAVSQHIKGVIRIDYKDNSIHVTMTSEHPEAAALVPELISQLGTALAQQLSSFFAIKGEIVEVNKPSAEQPEDK